MGNSSNFLPKINSSIGKELESKKVYLKKCIKYIEDIRNKSSTDYFEDYIISQGEKIIDKGESVINKLEYSNYLDLIRRSMDNYEVTLGRVDESSLCKIDNSIIIRTTKYMSYNMIENDCYSYIRRMKRKCEFNNIDKVIEEYVYAAELDSKSIDYIKVLSEYPIDSIRILLKIRDMKEHKLEKQWIEQINISKKNDKLL